VKQKRNPTISVHVQSATVDTFLLQHVLRSNDVILTRETRNWLTFVMTVFAVFARAYSSEAL